MTEPVDRINLIMSKTLAEDEQGNVFWVSEPHAWVPTMEEARAICCKLNQERKTPDRVEYYVTWCRQWPNMF